MRRPQLVAPILRRDGGAARLCAWLTRSLRRYSPALPPGAVEGRRSTALVEAAPGPIYWSGDVALNLLPYLPRPIPYGSLEELGEVPGPAWMIMTTADAEALVARHPELASYRAAIGRDPTMAPGAPRSGEAGAELSSSSVRPTTLFPGISR